MNRPGGTFKLNLWWRERRISDNVVHYYQ